MSRANALRGTKCLIQVGDGATPEVFAAPCALTTKGFALNQDVVDVTVPDCANPELAVFVERHGVSRSASLSGSGTLDLTALNTWRAWFLAGGVRNVRFRFDTTGANGGGYYSMAAIITSLNVTAENAQMAEVEIELQSSGAVAWTAAS